jgi:ABC-type phosphate transport system auxiliary subunit
MMIGDRERLVARIRQVRRLAIARERPSSEAGDEQRERSQALGTGDPQRDRTQALEARVAHLEQQLDGLQDSVHREAERQAKLIADLQGQVDPGTMGAALAEDARNRGL